MRRALLAWLLLLALAAVPVSARAADEPGSPTATTAPVASLRPKPSPREEASGPPLANLSAGNPPFPTRVT